MLPWTHRSPHPRRDLDRFSARFCTAHGTESLCFTMNPLKKCPFGRRSGLHLIHGSTSPLESTIQTASRSVQPFCRAHGTASLYFTVSRPFPQNCLFPWEIWTPSNTWFLEPSGSAASCLHLDRFSRFCRAHARDRPTDRPTDQ